MKPRLSFVIKASTSAIFLVVHEDPADATYTEFMPEVPKISFSELTLTVKSSYLTS